MCVCVLFFLFSSTRTYDIRRFTIIMKQRWNVKVTKGLKMRCVQKKREMKNVNGITSIRQRTMTWMGKNRCFVKHFFFVSLFGTKKKITNLSHITPPTNQQMNVLGAKCKVSTTSVTELNRYALARLWIVVMSSHCIWSLIFFLIRIVWGILFQ